MKTLKDIILIAGVSVGVALGAITMATNLCEYFEQKQNLDFKTKSAHYYNSVPCKYARKWFDFYEKEDRAVDIILGGSYGAKKAHEQYLENHCSDGD